MSYEDNVDSGGGVGGDGGLVGGIDDDVNPTSLLYTKMNDDLDAYDLYNNGTYTLPSYIANKTLHCESLHKNLTIELSEKGDYCNATSDSILCWPPTQLNATAIQKCFSVFNNVRYDDTRK